MTPKLPGRLWPALLALAGCSVDPTQLVVVIATDMTGDELDGMRTSVIGPDGIARGARVSTLGDAPGEVSLPASFGVAPAGRDASRRVTVSVEALRGAATLFETHALTGFVEHERLRLDLFLARRCVDEAGGCDAGETCTDEGCVDEVFPPGELPLWDPEVPLAPDAGAPDAAAPPAGEWVRVVEGPFATVVDVEVGSDGDVYAAGLFQVEVATDDGETFPPGTGLFDTWIARLDGQTGEPVWLQAIGGTAASTVVPLALAVHPEHGVAIGGQATGQIMVGGETYGAEGSTGMVVRLASDDGAITDVRTFPSSASARVSDVAFTTDGDLDVVGDFGLDLGVGSTSGTLVDGAGTDTGFRLRIGTLPDPTCFLSLQDSTPVHSLTPLDDGRIAVAGLFSETIDLGEGVDLERAVVGTRDIYVAQLDCADAVDLETIGGTLYAPAVARAGEAIVVTGHTADPLLSPPRAGNGSAQLMIAVISIDGTVTAASLTGGDLIDALIDVAPSSATSVLACGDLGGPATIGDVVFDRSQGIAVRIETTGDIGWARGFPPAVTTAGEIAASPVDGTIVVAGPLLGPATFGEAGEVATTGQNIGVFVYSFAP